MTYKPLTTRGQVFQDIDSRRQYAMQMWPVELSPPPERRRRPRLTVMAPVTVRGVSADGIRFEESELTTLLDNFSAGGALLRLHRPDEVGQPLFFVFALPTRSSTAAMVPKARIAVRGVVRRSKTLSGNAFGIGVEILQHRFIYGGDALQSRSY